MSKFKRPDKNDRASIPEGSSHPKYNLTSGGAGKGDMRGSRLTVLSEQGRGNYDAINWSKK